MFVVALEEWIVVDRKPACAIYYIHSLPNTFLSSCPSRLPLWSLLFSHSSNRTDECDLCIKLPVVSRRQATFRLVKFDASRTNPAGDDQGVYVVANYGKTNPTKLNDKAIGPVGREYGTCRRGRSN